ncbi:MAG TPA: hypothetical protein DCL44_02260 [Elusimicrobia bacterium]|nr:hypothetical protein [Elusimicrobiota bacterium]
MKKLAFIAVLSSFASVVCASDFSLETLKAGDIGVKAEAAVAPAPAAPLKEEAQVPQDLINRFNAVKSELWRLDSDTTWLRSDIDQLESTARRIVQSNTADHFFQNDLQRMSWDMTRYNDTAQRIRSEVKSLLTSAQKDSGLNTAARDMAWETRTLLNRAQFDIENSAQRLEWTVRGAKPELVGYNAQWSAMDISRYSRDFTWKVRDISYDIQTLISATQP